MSLNFDNSEDEVKPQQSSSSETNIAREKVSLLRIFLMFLYIGSTVFGGMWAATQKLEKELVDRAGWLKRDEFQSLLVAATLIPTPKFLGFSGLIGFHMGKWLGSLCAIIGLFIPASLLVLLGVSFIQPDLLEGTLAPLNKSIGISVVGLLFGNAYHQIRGSKVNRPEKIIGITLSLLIFFFIVAGVPLIIAAFVGFVLGAILIREKKSTVSKEKKEIEG